MSYENIRTYRNHIFVKQINHGFEQAPAHTRVTSDERVGSNYESTTNPGRGHASRKGGEKRQWRPRTIFKKGRRPVLQITGEDSGMLVLQESQAKGDNMACACIG